jgi:ribulose-5-phosphate 4-epimerase/fuculose-1-phosphate aldolase
MTALQSAAAAGQQRSTNGSGDEIVRDLVAANRVLAHEQVVDAFGHVSVRDPADPMHFWLARSLAPALVESTDILEYDLDGNPLDVKAVSSYQERFIHSEIYRTRRDVQAVVHCHAPSLIPFGVTGVPLRPMYHQSAFIAAGIPVCEIRTAAGMTNMLIKDAKLGRALAQALGDKPAALMRGHGAVIVGESLPTAVGRSVYLDLNARVQVQAMAIGSTRITYIDPMEARLYVAPNNYDRAWELWRREVNR